MTTTARKKHPQKHPLVIQPRREYTVDVGDGRQVGIAEFGPAEGRPILWFHGTPGARRQVPPNARTYAEQNGLRILGVERPGVGWSTPHLYDSFVGWARDVEQIADDLDLEHFGLIGLSGGGPYVLACAHELPQRVVAGAVLGGVAPTRGRDAAAGGLIRLVMPLGGVIASLRQPLGAALSGLVRALNPISDQVFDLALGAFPEGDRRVLERADMREMFVDDLVRGSNEAGLHSVISDFVLFTRPWGFSLRDIDVPVDFWQGDADPLVPFSHGAHQSALVPASSLTLRPGEGHLGGLEGAEEAIEAILSHWPRGRRKTPRKRSPRKQSPRRRAGA